MRDKPASLAILGAYPPPAGGVSVHVQRLCSLLQARGVEYIVYNAVSNASSGSRVVSVFKRRRSWMWRYAFTAKESTIYILSNRLITWLIGAWMATVRGKFVLIRLRNSDLPDWMEHSPWRRILAGAALRNVTGIVCVSRFLADSTIKLGVKPQRVHYAPGFLPPDASLEQRNKVDDKVWAFVEAHNPVIAANGKVDWYQGIDLYALDHLVDLAARLQNDYPRLGIVVCFWDHRSEDVDYLNQLCAKAEQKGVADNILFNTSPGPLIPVMAESDVFVRPTNTDGDANSIREALYLGLPAIASDCVERPEGVLLFRTRDLDDFEEKVRSVLEIQHYPTRRDDAAIDSETRRRIDSYLELLTNRTGRET